jgi:hypothetical protein
MIRDSVAGLTADVASHRTSDGYDAGTFDEPNKAHRATRKGGMKPTLVVSIVDDEPESSKRDAAMG